MIEHDDLRRARDGEHYRLARQLRRTLITLDRDYLDDRKFPPAESGGVLVLTAPEREAACMRCSKRLDREVFACASAARRTQPAPLPLEGRKLHVHVDWRADESQPMIVARRRRPGPARPRRHRAARSSSTAPHRRDRAAARVDPAGAHDRSTPRDCYVVPGFIDVHVHGVEGHDTLDGGDAVAQIAARLPRYGVTAFCPTTVACAPDALRGVSRSRSAARVPRRRRRGARVLPAHLESNFINPEYRGAQPADCLRLPPARRAPTRATATTSRPATSST